MFYSSNYFVEKQLTCQNSTLYYFVVEVVRWTKPDHVTRIGNAAFDVFVFRRQELLSNGLTLTKNY